MIVVIEDVPLEFKALQGTLLRICKRMGVRHVIKQSTSEQETENLLRECLDTEGVPPLLICDSLIRIQGEFTLSNYIKDLWKASDWKAQMPIIIYSETPHFDHMPPRQHSKVVRRIPEIGEDGLKDLKVAVEDGLRGVRALARARQGEHA
jgi:hypothetical protein